MNVDAQELQQLFRDSVNRYAAEQAAVPADTRWLAYAELGWVALRLPVQYGGIDADATLTGILMEAVGQHLLDAPLLASAVLSTGLLLRHASPAQLDAWLPATSAGHLCWAFAADSDEPCTLRDGRLHGHMDCVLHGDVADKFIVAAREAGTGTPVLCVVDAADLAARQAYRLVDGRGAASLHFSGTAVERLAPTGPHAITDALDEAAAALCAEAVGIIDALVRKTADYLKIRQQFGRPLASYQVLQHRLVDMFLLQQEARALTRAAEHALLLPADERARTVSGARAYVSSAVRRVANAAVQLHGGVGITDELDISHYFRRAMVVCTLFGGRQQHFERFVEHSTEQVTA